MNVSRSWQLCLCIIYSFFFGGRQRESSVKTLRSPFSTNFRRHCVLSCGTQRRAFPSAPERRNENVSINKIFIYSNSINKIFITSPRVGNEPTTSHFTGTFCAPVPFIEKIIQTGRYDRPHCV